MKINQAKDFLYEIQRKVKSSGAKLGKGLLSDRKNVLELKVLVGVDISGSISRAQFQSFMTALDAIKGLSVVKVIEIDDRIVAMYDYYKTGSGSRVVRLRGGGGTAFAPFFKVAKELSPDCILMFTDGEVADRVTDPGIPTGWMLTADGRKPYGFGKVVMHLPEV